jgi:hypothetical protein
MLKKILVPAVAVALFACSSNDDPDPVKPSVSSSSEETLLSSSSEEGPVFELLYDFEEESDYLIGYTYGEATLNNDLALDENGEEVLDEEGNPYRIWNPNGIFTLKEFCFNGSSTTSGENGGGLIIKNLPVKNYEAFKFDVRGTAPRAQFKMTAEKTVGGVVKKTAWQKGFDVTEEFGSVTITIDDNFSRIYNDTDLSNPDALLYTLENATEVEFIIRANDALTDKQTLEVDNFEGALKTAP